MPGCWRSRARNVNSRTTLAVRPEPLASRPMPRGSAGACGRASSRRTSTASGSCSSCSWTAWSSPVTPSRSATRSPPDRRASGSRFVDCEQTIKAVFQVHAVDGAGKAVMRRKLRRSELIPFFEQQEACTVVIEACGAAHHWARLLGGLGHDVRLIAPEAVKPFVKKGKKNDAADAAALCAAASRPDMRFVPAKSLEQQGILALHSARSLLVKQQTMLANAMRSLATEFGLTVPKGLGRLEELAVLVDADEAFPAKARQAFTGLFDQCKALTESIMTFEAEIVAHARHDETARRLATIPGIGPITASLMAATVGDISMFKSARARQSGLALHHCRRTGEAEEAIPRLM